MRTVVKKKLNNLVNNGNTDWQYCLWKKLCDQKAEYDNFMAE